MHFGVVGDIHGDFGTLGRIMSRHPDVAFWLSVGDVASEDLRYPEPPAPLYFIKGNNEDFDVLAAMRSGARAAEGTSLHFLDNATRSVIDDVVVAALGGTFAPTWYETPAPELPYPARPQPEGSRSQTGPEDRGARSDRNTAVRPRGSSHGARVRDDKRRHFVRDEVDACKAMRGVDVLLTHEAARPFVVVAGNRRIDAGKTPINEVLAAMRPRLHFFGHHHRATEASRQGVPSIGLDLVSQSWVRVDAASFGWQRIETAGA